MAKYHDLSASCLYKLRIDNDAKLIAVGFEQFKVHK
jgi:hypothetical protein